MHIYIYIQYLYTYIYTIDTPYIGNQNLFSLLGKPFAFVPIIFPWSTYFQRRRQELPGWSPPKPRERPAITDGSMAQTWWNVTGRGAVGSGRGSLLATKWWDKPRKMATIVSICEYIARYLCMFWVLLWVWDVVFGCFSVKIHQKSGIYREYEWWCFFFSGLWLNKFS